MARAVMLHAIAPHAGGSFDSTQAHGYNNLVLTPYASSSCILLLLSGVWQNAATPPPAGGTPAPAPSLASTSLLPTTMPYRLVSGLIVVDAALGAGLPRPAAIDTGLPNLLIEAEAAKRLSLKGGDPHAVQSLYGPLEVSDLPAQSIRLGQTMIDNMPIGAAARMGVLSGRHPPETPDLWLGTALFELLTVTLEPARSQIIFTAAAAPLPPKAPTVPFELKNGAMIVSAKANGKASFSAIIDTGAFGLLLPASVTTELKLKPAAVVQVTLPDGKPGKVAEVTLKELSIGPIKHKDVRALTILEGSPGPIGSYGIIGSDLLLKHRVTFSFAHRKLAFEKPRPPEPVKLPKPKPPPKKPETRAPAPKPDKTTSPPGTPGSPS